MYLSGGQCFCWPCARLARHGLFRSSVPCGTRDGCWCVDRQPLVGAAPDALRRASHPSCHWACFSSFGLGLPVPLLEFCPQHIGLLFFFFSISGLRLPLLIVPRALPVCLGSFCHLFPLSFLSFIPTSIPPNTLGGWGVGLGIKVRVLQMKTLFF